MAKVIILIGKTGSGKSTLANVLVNEDGSFTEIFKESGASVSGTKEIQKEEFIENNSGIKYAVIDTVGIGDTKLKKEEVLDKIAEAVYLAREGVTQVLFVTNGRFDQFEMTTYNLLRTIIFDEHITNHTTIVRTKFEEFEDEEECQTDIKKMLSEKEICEIVGSCQKRIIHVNNSSLSSKYGKEERTKSRRIILNHLQKKCLEQKEDYKPQRLQELSLKIAEYMEKKIKSKNKLEKELRKRQEEKSKAVNTYQHITATFKNDEVSSPLNRVSSFLFCCLSPSEVLRLLCCDKKPKTERINGEEVIELEDNQDLESSRIKKLRISSLENEVKELVKTKKLKEEVEKNENFIRKIVLGHILHNQDEVARIQGGDFFIKSIFGNETSITNLKNLIPSEEDKLFDELLSRSKELEKELQEKGSNDQSLEQIKTELGEKEKELLKLKKQLLEDREIFEKWQKHGFSIQQAQEWADALGDSFNPENDASLCAWLRDNRKLESNELFSYDVGKLKSEYAQQLEREITISPRRNAFELPNTSDYQQGSSITRGNSVQRRFSFSNVHESGKQRLLAAKRAEYQEKLTAFDDLIQRRRGSTLRLALVPDVTNHDQQELLQQQQTQIEQQSNNSKTPLLIVSGVFVVGLALLVDYLWGKKKKAKSF